MVKEITAVTTPTKDNRPSYTFKSSKAGTISNVEELSNMVGGCSFTPQHASDTLVVLLVKVLIQE